MKCPSCGHEIPEGYLLCEKCGTEIQIVPDFEPEVENSINQTLSDLADEFVASAEEEAENEEQIEKQKSMIVLGLGCVFIFALIVLVIFFSVRGYKHSPGYLLKKATTSMNQGAYEEAVVSLQEALTVGSPAEETNLLIAECYHQTGRNEEYLSLLLLLSKADNLSVETQLTVYERLVTFYAEAEQYEQINTLLQNCTNNVIQDKYAEYMANMPEFNYLEGAYNEIIPLKMLANTAGHIYYTMNGTMPTKYSQEYISPIFLDTGDYEITAMFINEYGIKSPLAKVTYHVDVSAPFAPEVDAYSGDFLTPQLIHAEAEEDCQIYYTTDDSEPTPQSTLYNGFLPMPLGKSTFKFIAVDANGVSSEVTVRNYNLELLTDYTVSDAQNVIYQYLINTGKIITPDGYISLEDLRKMIYTFACCIHIEEEGDFYIFSEYVQNLDGGMEKTGNYYAVGIYNLPLYGTQYDASTGTFALRTQLLASGT